MSGEVGEVITIVEHSVEGEVGSLSCTFGQMSSEVGAIVEHRVEGEVGSSSCTFGQMSSEVDAIVEHEVQGEVRSSSCTFGQMSGEVGAIVEHRVEGSRGRESRAVKGQVRARAKRRGRSTGKTASSKLEHGQDRRYALVQDFKFFLSWVFLIGFVLQ
jgi:hypothetical protein